MVRSWSRVSELGAVLKVSEMVSEFGEEGGAGGSDVST
ncbi:hypothetical protein A2U01_0071652 [Trifolium medium]|uniref:Uncharacterized protein n=1 Tax=Trifolium medium TaxID=97028 RepID=A0A392SNE8_9FABA|nr:hypothetical protein [Trifolium medium]